MKIVTKRPQMTENEYTLLKAKYLKEIQYKLRSDLLYYGLSQMICTLRENSIFSVAGNSCSISCHCVVVISHLLNKSYETNSPLVPGNTVFFKKVMFVTRVP